ncbi:MAG TPA: ABC transporter substrate binding protein, partial [Pyrinomonadaceae bacterium]|nr:ABC transporter substrate binding protein [Pyrinomonadaceae bacterium]
MSSLPTVKPLCGSRCRFRILVWLTLLAIPAWPAVTRAEQVSTPIGILVLYYYGKDYPANVEFEEGVLAALKTTPPGSFEYYPEYLEPNRFPGKLQSEAFQDYLRKKYADHRIDVVIAQTDIAFSFLKERRDLFPNSPIVFFARKRPDLSSEPGQPGYSGIVADHAYQQTLDLALTLHPRTRRVYVITGTPDNDPTLASLVEEQLRPFAGRLEITYLTNLPLDEMLTQVRNASQGSLILYVRYSQDEPGKTLGPREILALVAQSSNVPIYGIAEGFVGHGIVGGYLFRQQEAGKRLGEMAVQIANGDRASDVPIDKVRLVPMFDWRQLQRWNIPESQLPTGSVVRFKDPTLWELYKWRIIGAISLIVLQAIGIVWLLFTKAKLRLAEKRSTRFALLAEAEHQHLDEIVANVPGIVWEARLEGDDPVPKTTFVSPYLAKMLGYTAGEWMAKPGFWLSVIVDDDREWAKETFARVLETGADGTAQVRYVTKDGRVLWVESHLTAICDENGKPVGLRGVTMNISDRRQAEAALKENQAQLAGIIGSAMDAIISIDERQRVVLFNAAAENMFGCSATEALAQPLNRFIPTPFRDAHREHLSAMKRTDGAGLYIGSFASLTGRRAGGENFPVDVSISEVELNGTRFFTIILRDTTERLRAEQALRERRQELSEAQRVAKVGSWEWDPASDKVTWSEEMFRIMGRDPALPAPSYREHPQLYRPASWQSLQAAVEK